MIMAHSMPQPRAAPKSALNRSPGSADHFSALEEGLSPAAGGGGRASGRGGSGHSINQQKKVFMETLLGTSVSEACAKDLSALLLRSYINVLPLVLILWYVVYCIDERISEANSEATSEANQHHVSVLGGFLNFDEKVATVLLVLGCVPMTMIVSGWHLYIYMPCVIVRERLEQMTAVVSNMTGHRRDYNAVMSMVQAAHENTLRLSALLTSTATVNCGVGCTACILFCVCGILPRPECRVVAPTPPLGCSATVAADGVGFEQDHVFNRLPPWLCCVLAAVVYINALLPLYAAAATSLAVDDLMAAVGALRYNSVEPETVGAAAGRVTQSRPDDLIRIGGLQQVRTQAICCNFEYLRKFHHFNYTFHHF